MKKYALFLLTSLIASSTYALGVCRTISEVQKIHADDMFLHKKVNAKNITEYVWVRSGRNGDIEFVYYLKEGKLCHFETYRY
jgi:hypothetical protein